MKLKADKGSKQRSREKCKAQTKAGGHRAGQYQNASFFSRTRPSSMSFINVEKSIFQDLEVHVVGISCPFHYRALGQFRGLLHSGLGLIAL